VLKPPGQRFCANVQAAWSKHCTHVLATQCMCFLQHCRSSTLATSSAHLLHCRCLGFPFCLLSYLGFLHRLPHSSASEQHTLSIHDIIIHPSPASQLCTRAHSFNTWHHHPSIACLTALHQSTLFQYMASSSIHRLPHSSASETHTGISIHPSLPFQRTDA
jgi:hypothetical protein